MFPAGARNINHAMNDLVGEMFGSQDAYLGASVEEPATCGRLRKGAFSVAGVQTCSDPCSQLSTNSGFAQRARSAFGRRFSNSSCRSTACE